MFRHMRLSTRNISLDEGATKTKYHRPNNNHTNFSASFQKCFRY